MESRKMEHIPIRSINTVQKDPKPSGKFNIRKISTLLSGKDMVQKLHRHDFFFFLALEKGRGKHIIDFTSYPIENNSMFFLRPGQVHQLSLKRGSTGYLIEFDTSFYSPPEKSAAYVLRKVSSKSPAWRLSDNCIRRRAPASLRPGTPECLLLRYHCRRINHGSGIVVRTAQY